MSDIIIGTQTGRMYTYMGYTLWWHENLGRWIASKDGSRCFETKGGVKQLRTQIYNHVIAAEKKRRHEKQHPSNHG